jgi:hypothetical protein
VVPKDDAGKDDDSDTNIYAGQFHGLHNITFDCCSELETR